MCKVSVIVPVYNLEQKIEKCVFILVEKLHLIDLFSKIYYGGENE